MKIEEVAAAMERERTVLHTHMGITVRCRITGCITRYNSRRLSAHHIIPLAEDYDRRLDDDNLITLCSYHHELAERGVIPRPLLLELARASPKL